MFLYITFRLQINQLFFNSANNFNRNPFSDIFNDPEFVLKVNSIVLSFIKVRSSKRYQHNAHFCNLETISRLNLLKKTES